MNLIELQPGDVLYAAMDIINDGSLPGTAEDALIAAEGTRGVLINVGHLEEDPDRELFLVRFENADGVLGMPTGCWPEELRAATDLEGGPQ